MSLTQWAIEKNRITFALLGVVLVGGMGAFVALPRNEDPGFIIRTALVTTIFPGASPDRVEQLVTDKLEKAIQEMPELDHMTSESKTGVSLIYADFKDQYTQMQPIFDKLRRKVERARDELPDSVIGPTVDDEFGDVFGVILGITGGAGFDYRYLKDVADEVRDELLLIDEVAKVEIYGAQEERVFVEYNNARLAEAGLSPLQLQSILESQNIIIPGGEIRTDVETLVLEPSGNFESLEELERTIIRLPGRSDVVYLQDLALVRRGYIDPARTKVHIGGADGLALAISLREGGNIETLGRNVRETMDRLRAFYPIGIDWEEVQFQPDAVTQKIRDFNSNLLQAVGIVTGVMLLFLGLRTGLVVASLIPMAMVSAFLVMGLLGIGLDQMSIASLIIALGMLVDNAIVMSESIMVQMGEGKPAVRAAIDSAEELKIPLLTSSLTTAAAFLPIYLAESTTGEYTAPLFKVVTITLLCSWILSLTVIPLLCAKFLRVARDSGGGRYDTRFYRAYESLLLRAVRHRGLSLLAIVGAFALAVFGLKFVPNIFFPPNDRPTFTIELELPRGTPITRTEERVADVERFLKEHLQVGEERSRGISSWGTFIGRGAPRFILPYTPEQLSPNYAILLVNATSREVIDEIIPEIERYCDASFPDLEATIRPLSNGPPAWPPVEVRVSGRSNRKLFDLVAAVKAELASIPGTKLIDDDWGASSKKLLVRIDQPRARRAGVTSQDVAISLQTFLSGLEVTDFREGDELIPVTLRSAAAERQSIDQLEALNVSSQATGHAVPLSQVAEIIPDWQPSVIRRRDRVRTVTVGCAFGEGMTVAKVTNALQPWLDRQSSTWGPGYGWSFGGEKEASDEANASIVAKLPFAGLFIVLLLVGQFNSFRRATIILLTIPLAIIGVVPGLLIARSYFGFMTLLGIVSLAGIVINNAIVLIDRIAIEIQQNGLSPQRAVLESGKRRLRPILLTTTTTVGGLVPLWLGGGAMWQPMAITIIFGLIFATVLTLGVVPVLYSLMFGVDFKSVPSETPPGSPSPNRA